MTSTPSSKPSANNAPQPPKADHGPILLTAMMFLGVAWLIATEHPLVTGRSRQLFGTTPTSDPIPLVMEGGDPYVRALMRTISAAESNTAEPYHTLYGGKQVESLEQHPDLCRRIVAGPNIGDCTTAAGRYQFLTTTWVAKAERYHPHTDSWRTWWAEYSFEPAFQDVVVYRWLTDDVAWGNSIPQLLRQDRLPEVLEMLSGTWTSLGYGIEDNVVTPYLEQIYRDMLKEELRQW